MATMAKGSVSPVAPLYGFVSRRGVDDSAGKSAIDVIFNLPASFSISILIASVE